MVNMKATNSMTPEQSLEIIRKSIEESRTVVNREMGIYFLWWGILTFIISIVVGMLWNATDSPKWNMLWALMAVLGYSGNYLIGKKRKKTPENFVSKALGWIWITFGLLCIVCWIIGSLSFSTDVYGTRLPITAVIILLGGFASTVSGFLLKNNAMVGASLGCAVVCANFCIKAPGAYEMFCMALFALVGMVIPGIVTMAKKKEAK